MTDLKRRRFLTASALGGAAALAMPAVARAEEAVQWRMQALWDGGTTPFEFEKKFVERVSELTDGQFEIKLFSAGQLVPANQAFDAVRSGAFQLMKTFDGYEAGKIPSFAFTSTIPFGFPDPDQYEAWFYELGGLEMAREAYGKAGLTYIAPTVYGEEPMHSTVKIESIADMAGKKGRFVGLASAVMGDLGVAVTPMATAEVYSGLEKGLIDFADRGDLTANYEAGLAEVAKFIILPGVHQPTTATSYVANSAAYDALPESYKAALAVAAREISGSLRQRIIVQNSQVLDKYREQGVEVIYLDPVDVAEARSKAVTSWKAATKEDPLATKIVDSQIGFMQSLGLI
ncbi:TRAP transporter substrate-binding protein DctP (plasmid) [Nitratireductor aquimarinus]|uniref:TRAP transporter substrate-binding protein DctP n=1 Tax=Alphaproteobacteria TaxID=28211 RepID=UPI001C941F8A|nr:MULTISPECIES: TRAP transporter substrate-binding protein DctP [Alphaproteobacteria]MBY6000849.1 TRAP transporter substrate-binding protein DctP [Tritonibacter mobilis]MBY6022881.1 TRAP transporter substrate-binding protein DctP [Nitratireductor sp. DP7N14-4]